MFIVKFNQVSDESDVFTSDKNGNLPYIGELIAGKANSTIMNGTMFERESLKTGIMYACENGEYENPDTGEVYDTVIVLGPVSLLEYQQLAKELGKPKLLRTTAEVKTEVETEVNVEDDLA